MGNTQVSTGNAAVDSVVNDLLQKFAGLAKRVDLLEDEVLPLGELLTLNDAAAEKVDNREIAAGLAKQCDEN